MPELVIKIKAETYPEYMAVSTSNPYLVRMDDVMSVKIHLGSIEPQYILVAAGKKFPMDKFIEGINYMVKFG